MILVLKPFINVKHLLFYITQHQFDQKNCPNIMFKLLISKVLFFCLLFKGRSKLHSIHANRGYMVFVYVPMIHQFFFFFFWVFSTYGSLKNLTDSFFFCVCCLVFFERREHLRRLPEHSISLPTFEYSCDIVSISF